MPLGAYAEKIGVDESALVARAPRRLYAYPGPAGLPELREAVARTLARDGLAVSPDEVVATNGTQQG